MMSSAACGVSFMVESFDVVTAARRIAALKAQCKKHQLFREKPAEVAKMSEAGSLHAQIALHVGDDPDERQRNYEEAAVCFSRAKRLCRDILRARDTPA